MRFKILNKSEDEAEEEVEASLYLASNGTLILDVAGWAVCGLTTDGVLEVYAGIDDDRFQTDGTGRVKVELT